MGLKFRRAAAEDFEYVLGLMVKARERSREEQVFQWDERYPTARMLRRDIEAGHTTIVSVDGSPCAFFTSNDVCEDDVHGDVRWLNGGDGWVILRRLCVDPDVQDHGVGQAIIARFEIVVRGDGIVSIRLDIFHSNERTIHVYEKLGYRRVGDAVCEREPFFIYEKLLTKKS